MKTSQTILARLIAGTLVVGGVAVGPGYGTRANAQSNNKSTVPLPANAPFAAEINAFLKADAQQMPPQGAVLFMGSSSIRLWDSLAQDFSEIPVIKRGFGGSQIFENTLYADRIAIPYKPKMIVFFAGTNDLAYGKKTPQQLLQDYKAFVTRIHAALPDTRIVYLSINPTVARWNQQAQVLEANHLIEKWIFENNSKTRKLNFINSHAQLLTADGQPQADLLRDDGLHLNTKGYKAWTAIVKPRVMALAALDGVMRLNTQGVLQNGAGAPESVKESGTSGNPLFPGWYADPEVAVFNKRYWIYPTYSAPYDQQVFMDAFSSTDLVTWTKHPRIIDTAAVQWARRAMWAPSVIAKNGKYFLFFSANDIQNDQELGGIGVAVSDSPSGPFKDYLGKPLLGQIHNRAQPIDQFVFQDKDGQYYMIYGGWGRCNITRLKDDFTGFLPFPDGTTFKEITPKGYVEGPVMFVRNGKYYFMWSEGGWGLPNYRVAYAIADSPLGPFERIGTILQQDPAVATGAGHHSVLQVPGTDDWYIVYHRRPLGETSANHRVTCIDRMFFDEKGFIQPVKITNTGVPKQSIK